MTTQEIINEYINGCSLNQLSKITNKNIFDIKSILLANNIHIRSRGEQTRLTNMNRSYACDSFYFDVIGPNQAWIMGFLAADGSISKDRNTIKICINSIDREILEKIQAEIKISRPIEDGKTNNGFYISKLSWSNLHHKEVLANYGIIPNKTYFSMNVPNWDDINLQLAFILGYFDGDGTLSISQDNKYIRFRICAHRKEILESIVNVLIKKYPNLCYSLSQDKRQLYDLSISTKYAIPLLKDLYNLPCIHLDRKYKKFLEYIGHETATTI